MEVAVNKDIISYVDDIDTVPLILIKNTYWYIVSPNEFSLLKSFLTEIDSIPEKVWRKFSDKDILLNGSRGNNAYRILRNCVIKDNSEIGYRFRNRSEFII